MKHLFITLSFIALTIVNVMAQSSFTLDGLTYTITDAENHYVSVSKSSTTLSGELEIPSQINYPEVTGITYTVTSVPANAFIGCTELTTIIVPNTVTNIGEGAFSGCSRLTSITLPFIGDKPHQPTDTYQYPFGYIFGTNSYIGGTATEQHYYAKYSATSTTFYIPSSLKSVTIVGCSYIQYGAFYNCSNLTSVTMGEPVSTIGKEAFHFCNGLTSITLPNSVTSIGEYAFAYCENLTSVSIPESVENVGNYAFFECNGLTKAEFASMCKINYGDIYANPLLCAQHLYINGSETTDLVLPDSITAIGNYAFTGWKDLTTATIPNTVKSIGYGAFGLCSSLESITLPFVGDKQHVPTDIYQYPFGYIFGPSSRGTEQMYYGSNINTTTTTVYNIPSSLKSVTITGGRYIQCGAFYNCGNIISITIPDSVASIADYAFSHCGNLVSVNFPNSLKSIGIWAFQNCGKIKSANIPVSVENIGEGAFASCSSLTSITIPNIITSFGIYTFSGCSRLTSISIPNSVTNIGEGAFEGCKGLKTIAIPNSVTNIGADAFSECDSLKTATISKSVINIKHAFNNNSTTYYCEHLYEPEGWRNYESYEWRYWNAHKGIVYWGVSFVEDEVAYYITSDTTVSIRNYFGDSEFFTIPQSVAHSGTEYKVISIEENAFLNCPKLISVVIPNNITIVGEKAFNSSKVTFYCKVNSKPTNWSVNWNGGLGTVYWGVKIVDGYISHVTNASSHQAEILKYIGADSVLSIPASVTFGSTAHTVTTISESVFKGCENLKSITIPNTIVSIGDDAFNGCNRLPQIIIPNTVTAMGQGAFGGCGSLSIYCAATSKPTQWSSDWNPDNRPVVWGVKAEGDFIYLITNAARREVSIIKYTGNSSNVVIPSKPTINGLQCNITGIGDYAFAECGNMKQIIIPNSVQIIGNYAFAGCAELSQIIIGSGITSIGESAFSGCGAVSYIKIGNATPPTISESTFEDIDKWITVDVPCTNIDAYMNSNYWSDFVNYYEPPVYDITVNVENNKCGTAFVTRYPTCDNNQAVFNVTSNTGFAFDHWNDGNTDNPRTVAVTKDTSFTAFYSAAKINVSITTANATQGSVTDLSGIHYYSDEITISATANYGYHFTGWSDNVTTNPRTITLIKDTTIQAQFAINQYEISVNCNETERGTVSGGGSFNYLIDNTILATANYGYEFVHWSDNNTDNPRTIHLTCDTAFTAVFAPKVYELQVTSANEDLGTVAGSNSFEYKTVATIFATAIAAHHHFVQWNDGNRQNPREVLLRGDTVLTAAFGIDTFSVAAKCDTAMGAVSGVGLYSYGSAAKVEAKPAAHHHFVQWTNGAVQSTQEFVVEHDTAFEAVFAIDRHSVALAASDSLCGAVSGAGSYDYGASVQLQATPAANCYFTGWSDGVTTNPRTLTVEGDTTIVAEFGKLQTVNIMVAANDTLRGTVAGTGSYVVGSNATLSATASAHYLFEQWSDGRTDNPRTVRIIADATYTAVFVPMQYNIILSQNNADMGMVSGSGVYSYGERVSCLAKPYPNYHFVQWSNGETANPYEFVVEEDKMLTAYFAAGAVTVLGDESAIEPTIYAIGKTIVVENATEDVLVYDAMGKLICRDAIHRVRAEITVNTAGVYIVKTGNVVKRVVVE